MTGDDKDKMDVDTDSLPTTVSSTPKIEAAHTINTTATTASDEDDPVTTTYPVFLNPALPHGRRLLVLQQPNRTDEHPRPPPTELRIKTRTGMVELDVPIDATTAYDKEKGMRWGRSLKASMQAKGGGSHGVAGGFAVGAAQQRGGGGRGRREAQQEEEADLMMDWNEAARQGKVLTTQTLGGQYPDVGDVQYMVGVFQGKNLHLTPVSSLVHLRPQPHHIDATTHLERQASAKESAASGSGAGSGAGSSSAGARAIHMTIKTTSDGDAVTTETMADRLRSVQSENWRRMQFTDENTESAWDVYNESLFLGPTESGEQEGANGDAGKGKEKAQEEEKKDKEEDEDLEAVVPRFKIRWGDKELLEAVSDIKKPEPKPVEDPKESASKAGDKSKDKGKGKEPERPAVEEPPKHKPATRTRGGSAVGARRGGRPRAPPSKAATSSSTTID